jgi:hypothetical protein
VYFTTKKLIELIKSESIQLIPRFLGQDRDDTMLTIVTEVLVEDVSRRELYEFMLHCTDVDYQEWWPGMHLAFHTVRHAPGDLGNLVYFDEYIGDVRFRFHGVVTDLEDNARIVWQLKKGIRLPACIRFELEDCPDGILVRHSVLAGFEGPGQLLDFLFKPFIPEDLIEALDEHARTEFPMLATLLVKRRASVQ